MSVWSNLSYVVLQIMRPHSPHQLTRAKLSCPVMQGFVTCVFIKCCVSSAISLTNLTEGP